ncbi:MAG TPA: hypothetical protein VGE76_06870, partial [Opitutaceae bacterium]
FQPVHETEEQREARLLRPENLLEYKYDRMMKNARKGQGFGEAAWAAVKELGENLWTAYGVANDNVATMLAGAFLRDGAMLKDGARRQAALGVQAGAKAVESNAVIGEGVKWAFRGVWTKLKHGYRMTPELERELWAVLQTRDRNIHENSRVVADARLIVDMNLGDFGLRHAYAGAGEKELLDKASSGLSEVIGMPMSWAVKQSAKLSTRVLSKAAVTFETKGARLGVGTLAEQVGNTRRFFESLPPNIKAAQLDEAIAAAGNKLPHYGTYQKTARELETLHNERVILKAFPDSPQRASALEKNAAALGETQAHMEHLRRALAADHQDFLAKGLRPVTQRAFGYAVEKTGEGLTFAGRKAESGLSQLRTGLLEQADLAAALTDDVADAAAHAASAPGLLERAAARAAALGEDVSTAGRLLRKPETSVPYPLRLARETVGMSPYLTRNMYRAEVVSRLGRGLAHGIDDAVSGAAEGSLTGLLQGDVAGGFGEGAVTSLAGGFLGRFMPAHRRATVEARQHGDISDARKRRTLEQLTLFDAETTPDNLRLAAATFESVH